LEMLGGGGTTLQNIDTRAGQFVVSDSGLAFTIDIPQGVSVSATPEVKVQGLEGFSATTSREDGKLVVRLSKDEKSKKYKWKKLLERISAIDASNIRVGISGLKVDNNAIPDSQITLKASVAGFYDFALSETEVFYSPQANNTIPLAANNTIPLATTNLPRNADRYYTFFAAKQSNEGRDANAPTDKPNLISYTFKVNKAPDNPGGGGGGGTTPDPGRVDGDDRVETGIKISQKYYDKAKTVIVVRHDLFPDSMTASVLAKLKDAPILLNPTNKLDPRVGAEIKRLGAEEVIIVGGPDSISEKVRGDLKAYDKDKDVERIAGVDRYGTSEMVARRVTGITGKKNTGVIASGQVFPDALSVGTFASRDGYPILLVKKNLVPDQVVRAIKDLDIKKTYIAGGTNTISKSTEAKLPGVLERMAGKDRYETSVAIAKSKFKNSTEAFIASGEEFADALVISPVSGKYNRPTLLASRNKKTNAVVKKYIEESYLTSITAIGGEKYLPKSIMLDLVGK
ncbi:cell wall-binding repeat-containing protein, partial [Peptostreptococcus stomatis]